ncbi:ankyrin repeat-containing domain protein [Ilyonectria robusta]|uniref:ankyrin repeat-containing domain protein n=1 Tax=Ilyonectria robusta TaxID=1079257 RepID=UPI001E8CF032|nr:ankyrin repeat-containing domain protein [Ilyonectria robusta]KAH8736478.1 ankyrin repeat-containing domain protein [Ilyonectria robusta]
MLSADEERKKKNRLSKRLSRQRQRQQRLLTPLQLRTAGCSEVPSSYEDIADEEDHGHGHWNAPSFADRGHCSQSLSLSHVPDQTTPAAPTPYCSPASSSTLAYAGQAGSLPARAEDLLSSRNTTHPRNAESSPDFSFLGGLEHAAAFDPWSASCNYGFNLDWEPFEPSPNESGQSASMSCSQWSSTTGKPSSTSTQTETSLQYDAREHPLHRAIAAGNTEIVQLLLQYHASVEVRNQVGMTPLHVAVEHRNLPLIRILLQFGASVDARDNNGRMALDVAVDAGDATIVQTLLAHGANV